MADKPVNPDAPAGTADDAERKALVEWGTYVALEPIDIDGVRAFNRGEAVPVSHVERGVVSTDQVAKRTTKAGQEATQ